MSKVLTFSRTYPSYHPKAGQPTHFVEKVLNEIGINYRSEEYFLLLCELNEKNISEGKLSIAFDIEPFFLRLEENIDVNKSHTIRGLTKKGIERFKAGESFSPRVWSKTPYNSPQIIFAPDTLIKKSFDIKIDVCETVDIEGTFFEEEDFITLANNDGLSGLDLYNWIVRPGKKRKEVFKGQIICWNDKIEY
jgi:hypothetical protein